MDKSDAQGGFKTVTTQNRERQEPWPGESNRNRNGRSAGKGILVLGVGNPYRKDDGIGPELIRTLEAKGLLPQADLMDGGTDGLALLDYLKEYPRALILDAVDMGKEAGTIRLFSPLEAKLNIKGSALSTHGFGLAEVIDFMAKLGINTELYILGIQAKDIGFGQGICREITIKMDEILALVKAHVQG